MFGVNRKKLREAWGEFNKTEICDLYASIPWLGRPTQCGRNRHGKEKRTEFWWENLKERDHPR
jgi:hypothetical protein